jgi:hypothetical protein
MIAIYLAGELGKWAGFELTQLVFLGSIPSPM